MFSVLQYGYDALKEFGINQPVINTKPQEQKILPVSYYVLSTCAVIGAIVAIAGYIFSQTPVIALGAVMALVTGLGAYEIRRLSLVKQFETQVEDFRTLIDLFKAQISRLSDEKKELDNSISKLQEEIKDLNATNQKINNLIEELKKTDKPINDEIKKLENQAKEFKDIKEGLEKQLKILAEAKVDLQNNFDSQTLLIDHFAAENRSLSENVEELKKVQETFKNRIKIFEDENKKLKEFKAQSKITISNIQQESASIKKQSEELEKTLNVLKNANDLLQKNTKEKEEVSLKLEKTVEALNEKVNKKLTKIDKIKSEYEEKLKSIQLENQLLKNENEKLKIGVNENHLTPVTELKKSSHKIISHVTHQKEKSGAQSPSLLPTALHHHQEEKLNGTD